MQILCCPECKGRLEVRLATNTPRRGLKSGILLCVGCNKLVGRIVNFKADFMHFDGEDLQRKLRDAGSHSAATKTLQWEVVDEALPACDSRLEWNGFWEAWPDGSKVSHGCRGDRVKFQGDFVDVGVRLLRHPWSGRVLFCVDGRPVSELDLYAPEESVVTWIPIANDLDPGVHTVEIIPTGQKNPLSMASQVFFHELWITRPCEDEARPALGGVNRVLPFFPSVLELLNEVPSEGLILDCGCGDRILADPRYISVDCQPYQLPMVYADVQKLPFHTGTFDFVISQALLEHVPDPSRAVAEMIRVARPGGKIWSGMAFMQPVHAVPGHYFNATVWGLQELFSSIEILETSWFGEVSFTIDWLLKASGAAAQMDPLQYQSLMDQIKSLDSLVSYESLKAVASGVAVLARKPE